MFYQRYLNDRIVDSPHISKKLIWAAAIPAAVSLFSTLYNATEQGNSNAINRGFNAQEAAKNREFIAQESATQRQFNSNEAQIARDYNNWLLSNQTQMKVQDMRSAGLNPAFLNGSVLGSTPSPSVAASTSIPSGSAASSSASQISPVSVDLPGAIQTYSNFMLSKAQARKDNAQAKALEIENKRKQREDQVYASMYSSSSALDPRTGEVIDNINQWITDNPDMIPDYVKLSSEGSKGTFQAHRDLNQFNKEVSDVRLDLLRNKLMETATNMQLSDPSVIAAIAQLPKETLANLQAMTKKALEDAEYVKENKAYVSSQKAYVDLQKKITEDSNIMPYLDKAFNGDFSVKDFAKVLVLSMIGLWSRTSISLK